MQKPVDNTNNSPRFIIRNASNVIPNVQEIIREILPNSWLEVVDIAPQIFKKNSQNSELEICRAIWDYTKANFKYKEDPVGIEYIRYPSKSIQDAKQGIDCEDFCILGSAFLTFKNVKHYFKIIKYVPDPYNPKEGAALKEWRHIYLIVKVGNKEIILDSCADKFNDNSINQYIAEEKLFEIPQFRKNKHNGLSGIIKYNHYAMKSEIINPVSDPNWTKILYDQPTENDIKIFEKYLKNHHDSFVVMYHGTSPSHDILNQGIKVTSTTRRNSEQSTSGFVYLTPYPDYAKSYGKFANGHTKEPVVYQVKIPVSSLLPDLDNLRNQRMYAGLDVKNTLANSLAFAHSCRVKGNIPPYMLAVHEMKKGLGALEKKFWSTKENFVILLWQTMVRNCVTYMKITQGEYENTLPNGTDNLTFGDWVKENFPSLQIEFKPKEVKKIVVPPQYNTPADIEAYKENRPDVTLGDRYLIKLENQTFTFLPNKLAQLVYLIQGQSGLDYVFVPEKREVGKYEISPFNDELMKVMTPFVSTDELRPAMMGVNFDINGATATDAHRVLIFRYKNQEEAQNEKGIFLPKTLKIVNEPYPNYPNAIPQNQPYFAEVKTTELIDAVKVMMKYANKTTHQIRFTITQDQMVITAEDLDYNNEASYPIQCRSNAIKRIFGLNAKYLLDTLNFLKKIKLKQVKLIFSDANKAILIYVDTDFGRALFLQMPVMLNTYDSMAGSPIEQSIEGFSDYEDTSPSQWTDKLIDVEVKKVEIPKKEQEKQSDIAVKCKEMFELTETLNWIELKNGTRNIAIINKSYIFGSNAKITGIEFSGLNTNTGRDIYFKDTDVADFSRSGYGMFRFSDIIYPYFLLNSESPYYFVYPRKDGTWRFNVPTLGLTSDGMQYDNKEEAEEAVLEYLSEHLKQKFIDLGELVIKATI